MPVEFLSDEQVAAYGRLTGELSAGEVERSFYLDDTLCVNPSVRGAWWSPLAPRTLRVRPSGFKGR